MKNPSSHEYNPMVGSSSNPVTSSQDGLFTTFATSTQIICTHFNEKHNNQRESCLDIEGPIIEKSRINFTRKCLGKGSYGKVYLGHYYNTEVAIKKFYPKFLKDKMLEYEDRMKEIVASEVSILTKVKSPHCVTFYGFSMNPPLIVLEYCSNGSLYNLFEYVRRNPKSNAAKQLNSWEKRLSFAIDISFGICYLHELNRPIVHGDLKSPNILIDKNGNAKVTDFGLSVFIDPEKDENINNADDISCRNPLWTSPEVLDSSPISKKSDVFSFGIILWELMTFERPYSLVSYDKNRIFALHYQIVHNNLRPNIYDDRNRFPGKWNPILEDYIQLMQDCWKGDPVDRPQFYEINRRLMLIKMKMFPVKNQETRQTWQTWDGISQSANIVGEENMSLVPFPEARSSQNDLNTYCCSIKRLLYLVIILLFILIIVGIILIVIISLRDDKVKKDEYDDELGIDAPASEPVLESAESSYVAFESSTAIDYEEISSISPGGEFYFDDDRDLEENSKVDNHVYDILNEYHDILYEHEELTTGETIDKNSDKLRILIICVIGCVSVVLFYLINVFKFRCMS